MKSIILKEIKLGIPPFFYLFALLSALILLPNYPHAVGTGYGIIMILQIFGVAKGNRDNEFTITLPVPRNHIVLGKHFTVIFLELIQFFSAIPFAIISSMVINVNGNIVGMDANFAFFGLVLIGYAVFNIIFLPWHFKTGYKIGLPITVASVVYLLFILASEFTIAFVPILKSNLDSLNQSTFKFQIAFLIIGIILYILTAFFSYKISTKEFDKVNL